MFARLKLINGLEDTIKIPFIIDEFAADLAGFPIIYTPNLRTSSS